MGYRVFYKFEDGKTEDIIEGLFDTREKAEDAAIEGAEDYRMGGEVLREAGYNSCTDIVGWTIIEEGGFL